MGHKRRHSVLLAVLVAIALLAVETIALAHEIEHDTGQHDEPSCPLHLFVTGFAKTPGAELSFAPAPAPDIFEVIPAIVAPRATLVLGYRGRAPPRAVLAVA